MAKDPTEPIRRRAGRYAGVDEGTACTQMSFKSGRKAFLYVGMARGRYKAMFCLKHSLADATSRATKEPDRFEVGSMGWVTARFTADQPLPKSLWEKWLDESYQISIGSAGVAAGKRTGAPTRKK